jgi:outer membrane protein OmpA-like peptidoglycan-associated protein
MAHTRSKTSESGKTVGKPASRPSGRNLWSSAAIPPRVQDSIGRADRKTNRRGLLVSTIALVALCGSAAALVSKPVGAPYSLIVDAVAAGDHLVRGEPAPATVERLARAKAVLERERVAAAEERGRLELVQSMEEGRRRERERLEAEIALRSNPPAVAAKPAAPTEPRIAAVEAEPRPEPQAEPAARPEPAAPVVAPPEVPAPAAKLAAVAAVQPAATPTPTQAVTAAAPVAPPQPASCVRDVQIAAKTVIVAFEVRSAQISPIQLEQLKRIGAMLKACPVAQIEVAGHTDYKGQQERNFGLSWERAEAVMTALKAMGIDGGRMTPVGYGPRQPLSQTKDTENYSPIDRRVELIVR